MSVHNQIASAATLARAMRNDLDRSSAKTWVPTPTLEMLLSTLIDLAERDNPTAKRIENASAAFVASRVSGVEGR